MLCTRSQGILADLLCAGTLPGDDYLLAPFTPDEVALHLRWLTRPAAPHPSATLRNLIHYTELRRHDIRELQSERQPSGTASV